MSTMAKSNMNSMSLSREDSGLFATSIRSDKMRITRKESDDQMILKKNNNEKNDKYTKPFLLNLSKIYLL